MEESTNSLAAKLTLLLILFLLALSLGTYHSQLLPTVSSTAAQGTPKIAVDPERIANLSIAVNTQIEFRVNVTDAPAINGFNVVLTYNPTVLDALQSDYTGNVLESTGLAPATVRDCVDNDQPRPQSPAVCRPDDGVGVVSLALTVLGNAKTTPPTSGLLFRVQFNVVRSGFTQIHLQVALLSEAVCNADHSICSNQPVAVGTFDGFFSNIDCPRGSGVLCQPPTPVFTWSPPKPHAFEVVVFNASLSHGPTPKINITRYFWSWGEAGAPNTELCSTGACHGTQNPLPLSGTVEHQFKIVCDCPVTLNVNDTDGISWSTTSVVTVINVLVDLKSQDINAVPANLVFPGTLIKITATVKNAGTSPQNATLRIILRVSQIENVTLNEASFLNMRASATASLNATWNTSSSSPKIYRIDASVPFVTNETDYQSPINNNLKSVWVQLIAPFSAGLSLDLLGSTGVSILVLVGGGLAVSGIRRRREQAETLQP